MYGLCVDLHHIMSLGFGALIRYLGVKKGSTRPNKGEAGTLDSQREIQVYSSIKEQLLAPPYASVT